MQPWRGLAYTWEKANMSLQWLLIWKKKSVKQPFISFGALKDFETSNKQTQKFREKRGCLQWGWIFTRVVAPICNSSDLEKRIKQPYESQTTIASNCKVERNSSIQIETNRETPNNKDHTQKGIHFQEEIIRDILSRLPVRSLRWFKLVSKYWNTLISDPYFKMKHQNDQNPQNFLVSQRCLDKVICITSIVILYRRLMYKNLVVL